MLTLSNRVHDNIFKRASNFRRRKLLLMTIKHDPAYHSHSRLHIITAKMMNPTLGIRLGRAYASCNLHFSCKCNYWQRNPYYFYSNPAQPRKIIKDYLARVNDKCAVFIKSIKLCLEMQLLLFYYKDMLGMLQLIFFPDDDEPG